MMNEIESDPRPVIIIGGGMAGLSAAKRLKQAGVAVLVLEGRDRLGGRIHTIDTVGDETSWIDMGAAFIDDHTTNAVFHLLEDAGAGVQPVPQRLLRQRIFDRKSARWIGKVATARTVAKFAWRYRSLRTNSSEFSTLGQRIGRLLGERPTREEDYLLRSVLELLHGGPAESVHPNVADEDHWEYLSYGERDVVMVTGGYRTLVGLMSAPLTDREVFLDHAVTRVSVSTHTAAGSSARVETSEGTTFEGSQVIVTVPLGVLKADTITFEPPLPAAKVEVIERIGFGHVEKVAVTFAHAFWRTDPTTPSDFFCIPDPVAAEGMYIDVTMVAGAEPGTPTSPSLTYICGGDTARWVAANPEEAVARVLSDLEAMFPATFEPPIATATSTWSSSPFSRGCYAYPSADTKPGDFATLGEPTHDGHVLFAGEACGEGTFLGNVEAALVSGERAATAVLALRKPTESPTP